jgi:hypothetical protein
MANLAEGYGRHSDKEFANFLSIAHASVSEVQSHLYVALDLRYLSTDAFDQQYEIARGDRKDDVRIGGPPKEDSQTPFVKFTLDSRVQTPDSGQDFRSRFTASNAIRNAES